MKFQKMATVGADQRP